MAVTKTPRFQLPQWSQGSDPRPGRVDTNTIHQLIETQAAKVYPSGTYANRPGTNIFGSFYLATDQGVGGRLYYNSGTGWIALNTVGGGGPGKPIVINGTAVEGTSLLAARADHTHTIPLATKDRAGAMASQWAELCENATAAPTANTVAVRDSGGRLTARPPVSAQHVATMDWVLNAGSTGPQAGLAARNSAGQMSVGNPSHPLHATNKQYVDDRIYPVDQYATGATVMRRWSSGRGANVEDPVNPLETANRRYVDTTRSRAAWKTNIQPMRAGLNEVRDLNPVTFDYKADAPATGTGVHGGLVEQVARVLPQLVVNGDDGAPERIRDRELTWVLVNAVQQLADRVDELSEELDRLYDRRGGDDA
ncbi:tail fiber domain-containing protein [Kocuria rhizophila]|uniref:tail fiber domain-containing protein n=1 Tax=Kocuria rhizophila TaxID=72000 RepID=UPI0021A2B8C6|nr:tail fiber domain-containing protein [Kocuria rhizophila]MCT1879855.1 tail fiber domain-containing protein [Kocuria rhizophila]